VARRRWVFAFDLTVRSIPHPALAAQVSAPQPGLGIVLATVTTLYVPGALAYGLMRWPRFWAFHFAVLKEDDSDRPRECRLGRPVNDQLADCKGLEA
jgi:hypothetical protein